MPKHTAIMTERELEIGKMVRYLSSKTGGFANPKIVMIGGYALRHYIPFSRYSRDCDFVLREGLQAIQRIKPKDMTQETIERREGFSFMRWIKITEIGGKKVKTGVDFMQGQVVGREGDTCKIDEKFLANAKHVVLDIGGRCEVFVPDYPDLFLLKVISARRSDIRDIAALVWKNGIPGNLIKRAGEVTDAGLVLKKVREVIVPEISDKLFINSFRGTFVLHDFGEKEQAKVVSGLRHIS